MNSPSYDLHMMCSSPLLYAEGEDFLGQPVNVFEDEDISFDFIDSYEADFSIEGYNTNEKLATGCEQDQTLITERTTFSGRNKNEGFNHNSDGKTINEVLCQNKQDTAANNENGDSIHDYISGASQCFDGLANEVTNKSTENLNRTPWSTNAEDRLQYTRQKALGNNPLSQTNREISREKPDSPDDYGITASLSAVHNDSPYSNKDRQKLASSYSNHEKTVFLDKMKLPPHSEVEKTSERGIESPVRSNLLEKTNVKNDNEDSSAFCVKTSSFKRCIPPKTFYSPFWTPEKSTARQEKLLDDGLFDAQRNVDILYCYNSTCGSQKQHVKKTKISLKKEMGLRNSNKYTDFLKRRTVFRQQGNTLNSHNKDINGELSCQVDATSANNDKWISLPAIYTSSKPKTAHSKPIGASALSLTSIEGLIKKYKGHRFDLVEQQKRYKLKPFK